MQVCKYAAVFWQRYKELPDYDRHIKNIEKGEARIKRQSDIMHAIASKLDRYRNPWQVHLPSPHVEPFLRTHN